MLIAAHLVWRCVPRQLILSLRHERRPELVHDVFLVRSLLGSNDEEFFLVIKEDELVAVACAPPTTACRYFAPGLALGRQS